MYNGICAVEGCSSKLHSCLALADDMRVFRFVSDDYWGSIEDVQIVVRCIARFLRSAWKKRNVCKYGGGRTTDCIVFDQSAFERRRGADGVGAMAEG